MHQRSTGSCGVEGSAYKSPKKKHWCWVNAIVPGEVLVRNYWASPNFQTGRNTGTLGCTLPTPLCNGFQVDLPEDFAEWSCRWWLLTPAQVGSPEGVVDDNSWHLPKFSPVDPRGPLHFAIIRELKINRKAIGKPLCSPQKRNSELITVTYTPDEHSSVGLDSAIVCLCLVITLVSRPLARTLPLWCEPRQYQPYTSASLVRTLGKTSLVKNLY